MKSRRDRRAVLGAALASAVVAASTAGMGYALSGPPQGTPPVSSAVMPSAPAAGGGTSQVTQTATAAATAQPSPVDRKALLASAMAGVPVEDGARLSAAVLDVAGGEQAVYGDGSFDTASIVKVDILAALLLQAQDAGRALTAGEKSYATAMIERSDNASATALWASIGRAAGLDAANKRFGLTGTHGSDGETWGLTQTTAADQLVLLQQVFGTDSLLDADSRGYLRGLMEGIVDGQRWGVSAAGGGAAGATGAAGTAWALKNGWLPRSATGLWDINSVGRVTVGGREFLVAVLSDGNSSQQRGISMVERAAKAAVGSFDRAA
ncbi:serine hydrolase [Streptomyces sp. NPDC088789]|uniref:serine hydrolase n=1 Tax=Streptomyces sp. NPDC088789 TaxID=3365899 RepID=UPI003815EF2D